MKEFVADVIQSHTKPLLVKRMSETRILLQDQSCPDKIPNHQERATRALITAICISTIFFIVEILASYYSGSLAILSDSFHLLADISSFCISLYAIHLSQKRATSTHSWGYHRAEILGALFSTLLIWVLVILLVWEAIERIRNPKPIEANIMFFTALFGVFVNVILAYVLHSHGHCHDHHHEHHHNLEQHHEHLPSECSSTGDEEALIHQPRASAPIEDETEAVNMNITSATLHVIGDLVFSIGVLIAASVIWIWPDLEIVDPICTFLFSVIVLATTISFIWRAVDILMEGNLSPWIDCLATPRHIQPDNVRADVLALKGVLDIHDLHIWNLSVGKVSFSSIDALDCLIHAHYCSTERHYIQPINFPS
jgi:zinc transporter 2